jgi:hypothetical protein
MGTSFPHDFVASLPGFGGDLAKDQAQHRQTLKRTPVVLVHGNGGNATHPKWGMQTMKELLLSAFRPSRRDGGQIVGIGRRVICGVDGT